MPAVTADTMTLPRLSTARPGESERRVVSLTRGPSGFEGEGFPVRRAFAGVSARLLDPFIHMDQLGEVEYAPGEPRGTDWHPHRGFETVTYIIDGRFQHQDSHGGGGMIENGATQWMTAGSGVLHIETPPAELVDSGGTFHGIQLWVNLPRTDKFLAPRYQNLTGDRVGLVASADAGALVRIIAGEIDGHAGPGATHTPITMAHATVQPGARLSLPWRHDFNALAYVLSGRGTVGSDERPISEGNLVALADGDRISFTASYSQDSKSPALELVLLGGRPINEPVVHYGPFVMNTRDEIIAAVEDFQSGKFGQVPAGALRPYHGRR
ncbi:pirin [Enemella dayhoffiae]|uniref:Pirin n=1 Tax=Enemella dayhoffiae TaxID=2016507 RepID=A0A255HFK2_9ACTN|nr:pirin family protein [Enemella dayhoffiae]OYO25224.1 pirin [Enemella dayhoffiae]